jgi:hypothetical protein
MDQPHEANHGVDEFNVPADILRRIHEQHVHLVRMPVPIPPGVIPGEPLTVEQLNQVIQVAFWASLKANEGRTTHTCVVVINHSQGTLRFSTPIQLDESQIAKLAPAVPKDGCVLAAASPDGFKIWGFGRNRGVLDYGAVTIEIVQPGILHVGLGPFQPFAVVNGRQCGVVAVTPRELAHQLQRLLGKRAPNDDILDFHAVWWECLALADLSRMIFDSGHGGTLLIVTKETGPWEKSLSQFPYRLNEPDTTIPKLIRANLDDTNARGQKLAELYKENDVVRVRELAASAFGGEPWSSELWRRPARAIVPMAAVDGALIITRDVHVVGFGAKIASPPEPVQGVIKFEGMSGKQPVLRIPLEELGGTRHQSAAHFISANRDAVALVFSHDRHMSLLYWGQEFNSVVAVRNVQWWM